MKYLALAEVAKWRTDRISAAKVSNSNYISTENMMPERGGVVSATTVPESRTFSKYIEGDILLSNIRPYFKKIWFADNTGGCSNDVLVVRPDGVDARFLYYVLSDNNFFNYSTVTSKGTKMPRGSKHAIMKYLVSEVNAAAQTHIADILSAYDDTIENNNRRIALLEQAARELYCEWFVRMRFPGHENAKFVNGLPEGWEVKKLSDFGRIETGKTPPTKNPDNYGDEIMFVKTPDMHNSMYVISTGEYLSQRGHQTQLKKLLPPNSIMVSCIGTGGVVSLNAYKTHTNQQINSIALDKEFNLEWLYFTCKTLKQTIELFGATGATMTNLSKGKFERLKVLYPKEDFVKEFNKMVSDSFVLIKVLMEQSQNLAHQRDILLPRLMSGKLEV